MKYKKQRNLVDKLNMNCKKEFFDKTIQNRFLINATVLF